MAQMSASKSSPVIVFPKKTGFESFDYWILPGNCPPGFRHLDLHNQAFRYWNKFWTEVFKEISGERLRADDFFRQGLVCVMTSGNEIAGLHLYSFFNLHSEAANVHNYFRINYKPEHLERLKSLGVSTVMSMEYLTVSHGFRMSNGAPPVVLVLGGLGYRLFGQSGYDAMIAPCRRDLKVDSKAAEFGAEPFSSEFIHHGVPVIHMMTRKERLTEHADEKIRSAVGDLWDRRQDLTGFTFKNSESLRKAA